MSSKETTPADIVRPTKSTSRWYYLIGGVATLVALVWLVGWSWQLENGLIVTWLADWGSGGVTWGLYIGAFMWWVGIAHGGIILSAVVRLLGIDRYQPVARLAELLTIGALGMSGLYIVIHTSRPDRLVSSVIPAYTWTAQTSPLAWGVTVLALYFVLTATYLALTLRYDIHRLRDQLPDHFAPLYRVITVGYTEREDDISQRVVWWLALGIIVLAPLLLQGGVIPWLFSLLPSMPGWRGAIQGPQFLSIALTSAIAGVIIVAAALRRAYDWDHILTDDTLRGLTMWLGLFSLLVAWLQFQQVITSVYVPAMDAGTVMAAKLDNPIYIVAIGLMTLTLAYILAQTVRPGVFTPGRSVLASVFVLYATLSESVLFVVEGIEHPAFSLYEGVPGHYIPSPIEVASVAGTLAMCTLFFLAVLKVFPVIELHAVESADGHDDEDTTT